MTSDGQLDLDLRLPEEMGGQGGGTNPEQLFAIGFAACFGGAIGVAARRKRVETGEVAIDSKVYLLPNGEGGFVVGAELHVHLPQASTEDAQAIVALAHAVCPYSNATRGNIDVTLTANGAPVDA